MGHNDKHQQLKTACIDESVGHQIVLYEMDAMTEAELIAFEDHLLDCAYCRAEIMAMHPHFETILKQRKVLAKYMKRQGRSFRSLTKESPVRKLKRFWSELSDNLGSALKPQELIPALTVTVILALFLMWPGSGSNPYTELLTFDQAYFSDGVFRSAISPQAALEFKAGMDLYQSQKYDKAIPHLQAAAEGDSTNGEYWLYLGISHYLLQQSQPAVEALQKAAELCEPVQQNRANWYLAQAFLLQNNPQAARPHLEFLVEQGYEYAAQAQTVLQQLDVIQQGNNQ